MANTAVFFVFAVEETVAMQKLASAPKTKTSIHPADLLSTIKGILHC